ADAGSAAISTPATSAATPATNALALISNPPATTLGRSRRTIAHPACETSPAEQTLSRLSLGHRLGLNLGREQLKLAGSSSRLQGKQRFLDHLADPAA